MLKDIFNETGIEFFGAIPFSACKVISNSVLERRSVDANKIKSAVPFLVPYFVRDTEKGNISVYARARDYHIFFDELYKKIIPLLEKHYGARFYGFADKSAINEVHAAACAGLGLVGDNFLIINEKYGSFVFIGELLSEMSVTSLGFEEKASYETRSCVHCGACRAACPMKEGFECLSGLTQRKGELTVQEEEFILRHGSAWGCDICALSCPFTKKAVESGVETPIDFFREDRIATLSSKKIEAMDKEEFMARAFSWRGRKTVLRNTRLFEEKGIYPCDFADK